MTKTARSASAKPKQELPRFIEYVPIDDLPEDPANPKGHAEDDLDASLARFGFTEPGLIDERTGRLIAGHGRKRTLVRARDAGLDPPEGIIRDDDGIWRAPIVRGWSSRDDIEAKAYLVAANQLTIKGGWQADPLASLLTELRDSAPVDPLTDEPIDPWVGVGFNGDDLEGILADLRGRDEIANRQPTDADKIPDPPAEAICEPGDMWCLGPHRLICGDAREPDTWKRLLEGRVVNLAFTSPPYADRRKYDESSGFVPIHPDAYVEWFAPTVANVRENLAPDGSWFVNIKPGATGLDSDLYVLDLVLAHARQWGWHFVTELCWERNGVPKSVTKRFKNQFEPIYHFALADFKMRPDHVRHPSATVPIPLGHGAGDTNRAEKQGKPGASVLGRPKPNAGLDRSLAAAQGGSVPFIYPEQNKKAKPRKHPYTGVMSDAQGTKAGVATIEGLAYPGNRLPTFGSDHEALGHAAAFPIGLAAFFVRAYTDDGDLVLDPFAGTGSTILAAHRHDRIGAGIELSPAYCDIILKRYQLLTGERPVRAGEAAGVDFLG